MKLAQTKFYKPVLLALCVAFLFGVSRAQRVLNRDRDTLDLTKLAPLENAPPLLAFTTVALGGFRGLIANALWIRANELQENDQFFEMVQLADWITKLEPHFGQVWYFQAWNMTYNISVKFKSPQDRWRWVQRGIELLRDEGLRYNPDDTLLYRELSWFFQHKMGHNLDDAHLHYKQEWFKEMNQLLGKKPDYDRLLNPQTEEERKRVELLREKYKMDPAIMKAVDEKYGPLEWRLPDAHAVYWAEIGRQRGREKDQNTLVRSIYQTMQQSFRRGAIYENFDGTFTLGPNLDAVANVNKSYEDPMLSNDAEMREQPLTGHKNFLRDAVYFLYMYNRRAEAEHWFAYLKTKYPNAVEEYARQVRPNAQISKNLTLEEYALMRITEDVGETDVDRTTAIVSALIQNSFMDLLQDEDDRAANYALLAQKVWNRFDKESEGAKPRIGLPPITEIRRRVLESMLHPEQGLPPEAAARLRTKLGLAADATTVPAPETAKPSQ